MPLLGGASTPFDTGHESAVPSILALRNEKAESHD